MKANENLRELRLQFTGSAEAPDSIPLAGVVNSMREFSNVVQLLASYVGGQERTLSESSNVEFYTSQSLTCHSVRQGCLEICIALGPELTTIHHEDLRRITAEHWKYVHGTLHAINDHDEGRLEAMFPDNQIRRKIVTSLDKFDANQSLGFRTRILDHTDQSIYDGKRKLVFSFEADPVPLKVDSADTADRHECIGVLDTIKVGSQYQSGTKYMRLKLLQGGIAKIPYTDFLSLNLPVDNDTLVKVVGV